MNCSICTLQFDDQKIINSKEHIIPQAIGGRKKVKNFTCTECNRKTGDMWDVVLAKELNPLSLFFKIKKERSDVPSETLTTVTGEKYVVSEEGKITLTKPLYREEHIPEENKTLIHIQARNEKEAKEQIRRAKKNHPQLDIDPLMDQVKMSYSYCDEYFNISIGSFDEPCTKSIVKTAMAMAVDNNISFNNCEYAKKYLLEDPEQYCFGYFYDTDLIVNRPIGVPLHCIFLKGDPDIGVLWAYVEYFGIHRGLICLSEAYQGTHIESYYAINPKTAQQITDLNISLDISKASLMKAILDNSRPLKAIEKILSELIPPQQQQDSEREMNRVLSNSVKLAFENCGANEGEILEEHHIENVVDTLLEEMAPWIMNNIRK